MTVDIHTGEIVEALTHEEAERLRARLTVARRAAAVAPPRSREDAHVYFVQAGAGGPIKIGCAIDVEARVRQLQTAVPVPLQLLGISIYGGYRQERRLHEMFAAERLMGEWFRPTQHVREAALELGGVA